MDTIRVVFLTLIFCLPSFILPFLLYKYQKRKALKQLEDLKTNHNVTYSVVAYMGCMAFCDDEQKIYMKFTSLGFGKMIFEFPYYSITSYKNIPIFKGIVFWSSLFPNRYFSFFDIGVKNSSLREKMTEIIDTTRKQIESEYRNIVDVPSNAAKVTVKGYNGHSIIIPDTIKDVTNAFMWESEDNIYLFPECIDVFDFKNRPWIYKLFSIKKANIISVSQEGGVHYTTEVSGGGGGGSSLAGALIGGAIGGDVGAIIGSRRKTAPIKSTTKQIDDRTTNVKILDSNNSFCEILFDHNDYYVISKFAGK